MEFPAKKIRVGLLWHSAKSANLGVGALTLANIAIVEKAARDLGLRAEFTIIGWKDRRPPCTGRQVREIVELRLRDFVGSSGRLAQTLRDCDMVIDISAGDSFTDIYGVKRAATMIASKARALSVGTPLLLAPQTIGPFRTAWARRAAMGVMRRATLVCTRDDLSVEFLRSAGYGGRIVAASDVALRLPFEAVARPPSGRCRVGLNVSGLLFNGGYSGTNMFGLRDSYADTIRALLDRLTARPDLEVHLVPHVLSDDMPVEDDHAASAILAGEFPSVILAPRFRDPVEAKGYIAGMDAFAGARMHACIAALSSCVPVLPMAYSRKFAGLFGGLGYDRVADLREDSTAEIVASVEAVIDDRDALRPLVRDCLDRGLARLALYEDAVADTLRQAAMAAA
ncbi:Polysaccharide pyruvyl transferase family protein WcaK [Roseivivax marinus]|uniref:polysaccharide pyruvyl transferase family protein n=1 Tax=Roseivivax marinus TaxID=1379903 RepID=UPI0008ACD1D4|nr:polysaccharide pyruvyl transferase family protein [Roseivivax marinus]SEK69160.1 Polysaccharide pyruvyl transferase family protein WcaK [Roseivivax marinus]